MKLKINDKTIKIKKKKNSFIRSFVDYYKDTIVRIIKPLLGISVCIATIATIIHFQDTLIRIFLKIKEPLMLLWNNYQNIIMLLPPILYFCYKLIQALFYFRAHKYVPITHDELMENNIQTKEEYLLTIKKMFRWKPMKMVREEIENTCINEFDDAVNWSYLYYDYSVCDMNDMIYACLLGCWSASIMQLCLYFLALQLSIINCGIFLWASAITILYVEQKKSEFEYDN